MNSQKYIVVPIIVLLIIIGVFFGIKKQPVVIENQNGEEASDVIQIPEGDTQSNEVYSSQNNQSLWMVFSSYLDAAKNHDVEKLAQYAYTLSDSCKDSKKQAECFAKMDAVYAAGKIFSEKDFSIVISDAKQGMLQTPLVRTNADNSIGYTRSTIFFAKDSNGNPKILSFKNLEEWRIKKNPASTTAELEQALNDMVKDIDQDGLTDEIERCVFPDNMLVVHCVESNPNKRDSNGDGYWDSTEAFIVKK